jgi:hypothetical protein
MSNVNPADPFGLAARNQASITTAATPSAAEKASPDQAVTDKEPSPGPKTKRHYVRRGGVQIDDDVQPTGELILGYFSHGGLNIQKGKLAMTLTPTERAKLFAFMEKVE